MEEQDDELRVAFHEVGHAIIAFLQNREFLEVHINDDELYKRGVTRYIRDIFVSPIQPAGRLEYSRLITIGYGGEVAEKIYDSSQKPKFNRKDEAQISTLLNDMGLSQSERESTNTNCKNEAEKILLKNQDKLKILAQRLVEKRTLFNADIGEIMNKFI